MSIGFSITEPSVECKVPSCDIVFDLLLTYAKKRLLVFLYIVCKFLFELQFGVLNFGFYLLCNSYISWMLVIFVLFIYASFLFN